MSTIEHLLRKVRKGRALYIDTGKTAGASDYDFNGTSIGLQSFIQTLDLIKTIAASGQKAHLLRAGFGILG